MEFLELAKARYSCRKFSDRKVEKELLDKIIDAGVAAPTAINTQPFRIWVMESNTAVETIRKVCNYTFGAQTFLIVGCKKGASWVRPADNFDFSHVDAAIVATHMMLEIADLGLATTWVGYFDAPQLQQLYPEMQDYALVALFPVGYAAEETAGKPSPKHFVRKDNADLVTTL